MEIIIYLLCLWSLCLLHGENATCRTRLYLISNRNSFLRQQQVCKSFLVVTVFIKFTDFVKNSIVVILAIFLYSQYKLLNLVNDFDCFGSDVSLIFVFVIVYTPLSLESDFWFCIFCRLLPRRGGVSFLKIYELFFCWHSNYTWERS